MRAQNFAAALVLALSGVLVSAVGADRVPAAGGDIEITPILHSSVQIEHAGKVIQVDPWSLGDLSHAKPADLILITDDVGHHLDLKAIQQLRKPGAPVVITANGKAKRGRRHRARQRREDDGRRRRGRSDRRLRHQAGRAVAPKGEANGYVITLGGKRIYFAGVTECVPEVRALKNIDVAFMPMNIPLAADDAGGRGRVHEGDRAEDRLHLSLRSAAARRGSTNPRANSERPAGGLTIAQSLQAFKDALKGTSIEFRDARWYP